MNNELEAAFNRIFLSTLEGKFNYLLGVRQELERCQRLAGITINIEAWIEEAIKIRNAN